MALGVQGQPGREAPEERSEFYGSGGIFGGIANFVIQYRWFVIGAWAVAAVVVSLFSPSLGTYTSNNNSSFLPNSYQSIQATNAADKYFPSVAGASGSLVVNRSNNGVLTSSDKTKIQSLATTLNNDKIKGVKTVTYSPAYLSKNGKVQLLVVDFTGNSGSTQTNNAVKSIRNDSTSFLKGSGLSSGLTGNAAISLDTTNAYNSAETIITIATVLLIVGLLFLVFRSPIIALLPIIIIGIMHQMAQAFTADLAKGFGFQVGNELAPLLVVVMFGVGTDYIIFTLFRYREHLQEGAGKQALPTAATRVSKVIASAATTVIAAFAALLLANLESLQTLAPGLIVGVLVMLVAALTLIPALFSLLGVRLYWPRRPGPEDLKNQKRTHSGHVGEIVARHPARTVLLFGALIIIVSIGAFSYKPTYNTLAELPGSTPSQQAYNVMASAFPAGSLGPTQIFVLSNNSKALSATDISNLTSKLQKLSGVSIVYPPQYTTSKAQALIQVVLKDNPYSTPALNYVQNTVRPTANGSIPNAKVLVGGTTSQLVDVRSSLDQSTNVVFPVALAIILVILALLLRAIVGPIYLLIGVGLTFTATIGALDWVFLNGFGYVGLDFSIPIVVYLFVVAIGTDYNILMSHRLREEFEQGLHPREAARVAMTHGSPAVISAGLILAGTFASLLFTGIQSLVEIGFGVAFGVVIAAYVLSTKLVPATAALRHSHFWWPRRFGQEGTRTR